MKFQKGSRVEVMNKSELPTSWCVAEVVSGNKHTYNLRYDYFPGVEKVSREFIRPCPPLLRAKDSLWVAGDIVEVFYNNSWKTATVCNVTNQGHFTLRPHGFTHEIQNVDIYNIRTRQSWQNGQWVISSSKMLKRASPFCSSQNTKKSKTFEKETLDHEKRISEHDNNFESDECSVGSCSVFSKGLAFTPQENDIFSSDAEAFSSSREDEENLEEEEVAVKIHRMELQAYRSTLEALYASGPLSWEKEALLTNLRINLHISNDEHLTELRQLISVGAGILD